MGQRKHSPAWASLKPELLSRIQAKLGNNFDDFALECENNGLLSNNFVNLDELVDSDIDFACANCATALVSAANHYAGQGELPLADRLARWALMLEPHHIPALICLATIYQVSGNTSKENEIRNHANTIINQLSTTPEDQLTIFEQGILNSFGK